MIPLGATPAEFETIFSWRPPKSRKLSLLSFIAASAVLHAFCFYIFQIIYPPTAAPLIPPARVSLITAASEEGRVLLRWIESEDPALSSLTQRSPRTDAFLPPKPEYVPSYVNRQPALKDPPPYEPDLSVRSSRPPAPVSSERQPISGDLGLVPTIFRIADEATLGPAERPGLQFTATSREPAEAAQFRIAVGTAGDVRFCFLERSSGDRALDEEARRYLLLVRFPARQMPDGKSEAGFTWTSATIEWGNDVAVPTLLSTP